MDMSKEVETLEAALNSKYENLKTLFLTYDSNRNAIKVDMIEVHSKKEGTGGQVMTDITSFADSKGLVIWLDPAQRDDLHGTTSRARLIRFYKKFGFVENKGRNKDFTWRGGMYRNPSKKQTLESFRFWINNDN